jgi:hypothetical protein
MIVLTATFQQQRKRIGATVTGVYDLPVNPDADAPA